ncbi:diphosphomevalonate decarboxylase [Ascosphaera atra]|nr:diphosphomevalonate decarboxylase [Ascosphaera atra]
MSTAPIYRASATAPVNIAVIKYWGKRDKRLNLPTNSSLSVTLSQDDLRALTTASCSASYPEGVTIVLGGKPEPVKERAAACIQELRNLRRQLEAKDSSLPKLADLGLRIVSENNFPTAAGLASSAAGYAALVTSIAYLYELPLSASELSKIARVGSGSACRSTMGGYVAWRVGTQEDGQDSFAEEVAPASHWPEMRALILVVSDAKKDTPSTEGMQSCHSRGDVETVSSNGVTKLFRFSW